MKEIREAQKQILAQLRKSDGGLTVEALCKELGVTAMAVHRPLTALLENGLVVSEAVHERRRGRPLSVYKLTEAADDLFPKNYGPVLLEFLSELKSKEEIARITNFFSTRFKKIFKNRRSEMEGKDLPARVQAVSQILDQMNYMPESEESGRNEHVIRLFNCPISKVARAYPQICRCEQKSLSAVLEAEVTRGSHILNGGNHCSYIVHKK